MHVESIDASLSIQDGGIDLESKTKLALVICSLFSGDERKNADPCSLLNYLPEDSSQANVSLSSGAASPVTITP